MAYYLLNNSVIVQRAIDPSSLTSRKGRHLVLRKNEKNKKIMSKLSFAEIMSHISSRDIPEQTITDAKAWAEALDDPTKDVSVSFPQLPPVESLDSFETFMSGWVQAIAKAGKEVAETINHDPLAPHMVATARPGASTFNPGSSPLDWDFDRDVLGRVQGGPGVRIFIMDNPLWAVGVCRNTPIEENRSYEMKLIHGCLQPVGSTSITEWATHDYTLVFTYEGDDVGWVLASGYPGRPDPTPDRSGLSEGKVLTGAELKERGFVRAILEE